MCRMQKVSRIANCFSKSVMLGSKQILVSLWPTNKPPLKGTKDMREAQLGRKRKRRDEDIVRERIKEEERG